MMLDLALKTTVVLGVAWMLARLLRTRAASTRHAIWTAALASALMLPLAARALPSLELPLLPERSVANANATTLELLAPLRVSDAAAIKRLPGEVIEPARSFLSVNPLLAAWLCVALVLVIRLALAHLRSHLLVRRCAAAPPHVTSAAAGVASTIGVGAPRVVIAAEGTMPAVIGALRPSIVLPADALSWKEERLRLVLLHEVAHVRRRDPLLQVVANVASLAYWWHPLSWVASRRIARERELACDDLVLACGTPGATYAEHLLDIARSLNPTRQPSLAALAMARRSQLEGRVIALLDDRPRSSRPSRALGIGAALGLTAIAIIAPLKLVARAADIGILDEPLTHAAQVTAPVERAVAPEHPIQGQSSVAQVAPATAVDPQAAAILLKALEDADADVRRAALDGLLRIRHRDLVPYLKRALKDASADVRRRAVEGLASFQDKALVSTIGPLADDVSADVRRAVIAAIAALQDPVEGHLAASISEGVAGAVTEGVVAGVAGGVVEGVRGGIAEGVRGGIAEGVRGGIAGAVTLDPWPASHDVAAALQNPAPDTVYIFGQVTRPGAYRWREGMTVGDLIREAGGAKGSEWIALGQIVMLTRGHTPSGDTAAVASFAAPTMRIASGTVIQIANR